MAQFLAYKPANFALLTENFIECKHGKHKTAFRDRKVIETFE